MMTRRAEEMATVLSPVGPAAAVPDRNLVSSWSASSMQGYLDAGTRVSVHAAANKAFELEQHGAEHISVMFALAAAETIAARLGADELAVHAARLDAYASAHGLRGWYRYTDFRGAHAVQVNKIRTCDDNNIGRYFTHRLAPTTSNPLPYWVIDRDSGRTAVACATAEEAQAWIGEAGGLPASDSVTGGDRRVIPVETLEVVGGIL